MSTLTDTEIREAMANALKEAQEYGDDGLPIPERAVAKLAYRETLKMVGELLYDMVVESSNYTDLSLGGEKRKLCFISNTLRPIINALQVGVMPDKLANGKPKDERGNR